MLDIWLWRLESDDSLIKDGTDVDLVTGNTDLRLGIDGLATLVRYSYQLDPQQDALF